MHVVFGKVVGGLDVVKKMEAQGTSDGTPKTEVSLINSYNLYVSFLLRFFYFVGENHQLRRMLNLDYNNVAFAILFKKLLCCK